MPDRTFTPHELHQKAISVLDQLERIAADWRRGRIPAAAEIDVVTTAVAELRGHVERAVRGSTRADATAVEHLQGARRCVADALDLVDALAREHPGVADRPRTPMAPTDADPPPAV